MSAPLVFLDTETTGLTPDDEVWEIAAIRRETNGAEMEWHAFVRHDPRRASRLPKLFRQDHDARYSDEFAIDAFAAVGELREIFAGGAHMVGAVPSFDAAHLGPWWTDHGEPPPWHYHLVDVEALAAGVLGLAPPWDSDELSARLGVTAPVEARHTAMGDARWARDLYDAAMSAGRVRS